MAGTTTKMLGTLALLVLLTGVAVSAEKYSVDESEGDAKVTGSVALHPEGDRYKVHLDINVRKTGVDGNAFGAIRLVGLDDTGEFKFQTPSLSKTVGAKVPQGKNHKTGDLDVYVREAIIEDCPMLFVAVEIKDAKGAPRSGKDMKDLVLKNRNELMKAFESLGSSKSGRVNVDGISGVLFRQ